MRPHSCSTISSRAAVSWLSKPSTSAEEFAELLERPQHAGGDHTAEVDQHCGARRWRRIGRTARGLDGGHVCSYLSLKGLLALCADRDTGLDARHVHLLYPIIESDVKFRFVGAALRSAAVASGGYLPRTAGGAR